MRALDARVERRLHHVDQHVEHHEEHRQHQDGPLQERQVALEDGVVEQQPVPGQANTVSIRIEPPSR